MTQVRNAGFVDVNVQKQELVIDVPLAEGLVLFHLSSMPIVDAFIALNDDAKRTLVAHVAASLVEYVDGGRMLYCDAVNVVMAKS